jgi:pyrroline-5-carboxylate reductase
MNLVFIGGGNMAAAIIGGLRAQAGPPDDIRVVERDAQRRALLERDFAVATQADIDPAVTGADIVVLAVKPGDMAAACHALGPVAGQALVLSIAAGIPSEAVARWCGHEAVVRAMPNTPALIGRGITGLIARPGVTPGQHDAAAALLRAVGDVVWLDDEAQLDAVTAISGSGPAYVFYFMEALQEAAGQMGMRADQARHFAVQTFVGAAQLAAQSTDAVAVLRERVTSKGGTTAAALARLQADGVGPAITAAAFAALERSREMAREFAPSSPSPSGRGPG